MRSPAPKPPIPFPTPVPAGGEEELPLAAAGARIRARLPPCEFAAAAWAAVQTAVTTMPFGTMLLVGRDDDFVVADPDLGS